MEQDALQPYFRKVKKTNKDGRPRKQRKGWGRFQSVLRERSADFNLTLDVQNLRQEVQNLTTLRDVLSTQSLVQRHSPEGSLSRMVNEYFHVFRKGAVLQEAGRKRLVDDCDQRAFMHSMMDAEVDVGNGLKGPDVMMDQMATYSTFLRFICMSGQVHNIVTADDSVLISVRGSFVFQVLRSTIEMVFPHVMGDEWLLAELIGKEVEAAARSTFHFNAEGKCVKYDVDMDFVDAFTSIVKDPQIVNILLGRALIADNAMLGVIDEADVVEVEEKAPPVYVDKEDDRTNEYILSDKENYGQQSVADEVTILPTTPARYATNSTSTEFCQRIVEDYFSAFSSGFQDSGRDISITPSEASQRDFLNHRFALQGGSEADRPTTVEYVKERWRDLSKCFEVLGFQQKGVARTEFNNSNTLCLIDVTATYILRITFYTIRSVFPHLLANLPLLDVLVGKVIMVPSQIFFSVEKSTGRISLLEENMDFAAALAELVPDHQELDFVVSQSLLARDGVDCRRSEPSYSLDQLQHVQQHKQLPQVSDAVEECQDEPRSTSRSMSIADILG